MDYVKEEGNGSLWLFSETVFSRKKMKSKSANPLLGLALRNAEFIFPYLSKNQLIIGLISKESG